MNKRMQSPIRQKPLYRRVNTRTHGVRHGGGGKARWERNTKSTKDSQTSKGSMHSGQRHGLDYTPLFKFLLSKVGGQWDSIFSEAKRRLDKQEPIFWMVALNPTERKRYVRIGESSYYSGLYVDDNGKLAIVDAALSVDDMMPTCSCCTHTFNGERFTQEYSGQLYYLDPTPID